MMAHLNDAEFVDLLDDRLSVERRNHAESCDACRTRAAGLRETLSRAALDEVPEPSPLFWDHFSARVAEAIGAEPVPARSGLWPAWTDRALVRWAMTTAAVLLVVGLNWILTPPNSATVPPVLTVANHDAIPATGSTEDLTGDPEMDSAWAVVRAAADGLEWDAAHAAGISAGPGSAERVAMELTEEERTELARLIEDELRRTGA